MTGLLIFTFVLGGLHTLLWLPRSLKWKKEIQKLEEGNSFSESSTKEAKD